MPLVHPNAQVVTSLLVIPVLATLLMELAEGLLGPLPWSARFTKIGWDLCVLAVGSTGGVFTLPEVLRAWGAGGAVLVGTEALIIDIILGLLIIYLRRTQAIQATVWNGFASVCLGGVALAFPWYVVLHSV